MDGAVQNTPNLAAWSSVASNCPLNRRYTTAPPTNAPANCARMYPGTINHAKLPSIASTNVSAGLKDAPDAAPNIHAGSITASPQAMVI